MCPFTVRVTERCSLADFLGSMVTSAVASSRRTRRTVGSQLKRWICLPLSTPTPFNLQFRLQAAVSLLRLHVTRTVSNGILTVSSIGIATRLILRTRLTLGRLTLPRKPWSCGEGASHPLYRYLYLHLPFQTLQKGSRPAFSADWNAPLPIHNVSHGFGNRFHTRLLSMPSSSTSELLRTL